LDGPASVHDANRIHLGGNSHAATARWLERLVKSGTGTGALMTTTRKSLSCAKEIVDEYRRLGLGQIFVRPLHYLGFAKKSWHVIGYEDAEFIAFYRETLDYAIDLNRGGQAFTEATATMLLRKILLHDDPGYVDLRSPCGATLGQVSYNYDGGVYTCDEGRMIGADGDQTFKIGDVRKDRFADVVNHPGTKACCVASSLEAQPLCHTCTYKPYCGICPVLNYATQDSIWGQMPTNSYCYDFMHIFDALFERLQDPERKKVLESWVGIRPTSLEPSCAGRV
jgi:radical SAM protein with 4Fe4S-binding SPASM domain